MRRPHNAARHVARHLARAVAALGRECRHCGARDGQAEGGKRWATTDCCAACNRARAPGRAGVCPTCGSTRVRLTGRRDTPVAPVCPTCPGHEEVALYSGSFERVVYWPVAWCDTISLRLELPRPLVAEARDLRAARLGAPLLRVRWADSSSSRPSRGAKLHEFICAGCGEDSARATTRPAASAQLPTRCRACQTEADRA
jgi:hypothetical protein